MSILGMLLETISGKQEDECDLSKTPWRLHLKTTVSPLDVFLYFETHKEAKDQEDRSIALGWYSLGVMWYN